MIVIMLDMIVLWLYQSRILLLGVASATILKRNNMFAKMSAGQTMIVGIASGPLFISLSNFLLGLVFVGWGSWFYFIIPIILSIVTILVDHNYIIAKKAISEWYQFIRVHILSVRRWLVIDILISLIFVFLFNTRFNGWELHDITEVIRGIAGTTIRQSLNPVGFILAGMIILIIAGSIIAAIICMIRDESIIRNLLIVFSFIFVGTTVAHGVSMTARPWVDDTDALHYELDARYFAQDKDSWEVDDYTDEKYGSSFPDDHGPLWIMYLADADIVADTLGVANHTRILNYSLVWVYICFIVLLFFTSSYISGAYGAGAISLVLFHVYIYTVYLIIGRRDAFRFVAVLLLMLFVYEHFESISKGKERWIDYLAMIVMCYLCMNGHESNAYLMLGLFSVIGIMLLIRKTPVIALVKCGLSVLLGTALGAIKTIRLFLNTGRISTSTAEVLFNTGAGEADSKFHLARADRSYIWLTYTTPVRIMLFLGAVGLLTMILVSWRKKNRDLLLFSLMIVGLLLPLTGIMDWTGYKASLWFVEQQRYRMYFMVLASITGAYLLTYRTDKRAVKLCRAVTYIVIFAFFVQAEWTRCRVYDRAYVENNIKVEQNYMALADRLDSEVDGNVFTQNQAILYYLHGTPKLIYHPISEELVQARTEDEIKAAMSNLNVGAFVFSERGMHADFSQLPFWKYIDNSDIAIKEKVDLEDGIDTVVFIMKDKLKKDNGKAGT